MGYMLKLDVIGWPWMKYYMWRETRKDERIIFCFIQRMRKSLRAKEANVYCRYCAYNKTAISPKTTHISKNWRMFVCALAAIYFLFELLLFLSVFVYFILFVFLLLRVLYSLCFCIALWVISEKFSKMEIYDIRIFSVFVFDWLNKFQLIQQKKKLNILSTHLITLFTFAMAMHQQRMP